MPNDTARGPLTAIRADLAEAAKLPTFTGALRANKVETIRALVAELVDAVIAHYKSFDDPLAIYRDGLSEAIERLPQAHPASLPEDVLHSLLAECDRRLDARGA